MARGIRLLCFIAKVMAIRKFMEQSSRFLSYWRKAELFVLRMGKNLEQLRFVGYCLGGDLAGHF